MKPPFDRFLAALLVAALLLCHGAFGAWHQFSGHEGGASVTATGDHGATHGAPVDTGVAEGHVVAAANYEAAPLLLLLLGAALLPLLSGTRVWHRGPAPRFPEWRPPALSVSPPELHEAAVLQVFRL